jgi:hypothetical protein
MVNVTGLASGSINLLFAIPTILIKQFVFWANYNKTDFFASVVTLNHKLTGKTLDVIAGKSQNSAVFVVLAYAKIDCLHG